MWLSNWLADTADDQPQTVFMEPVSKHAGLYSLLTTNRIKHDSFDHKLPSGTTEKSLPFYWEITSPKEQNWGVAVLSLLSIMSPLPIHRHLWARGHEGWQMVLSSMCYGVLWRSTSRSTGEKKMWRLASNVSEKSKRQHEGSGQVKLRREYAGGRNVNNVLWQFRKLVGWKVYKKSSLRQAAWSKSKLCFHVECSWAGNLPGPIPLHPGRAVRRASGELFRSRYWNVSILLSSACASSLWHDAINNASWSSVKKEKCLPTTHASQQWFYDEHVT